MNRKPVLLILSALAIALTATLTVAAEEYTLQPIRVTANAPVKITLAASEPVNDPIYRAGPGDWKELSVQSTEDGVSFSLPDDAVGSTVILLNKPDWLTLPDGEPPVIDAASCDGATLDLADTVELGHLAAAPEAIMLTVSDAVNPIATRLANVYINDGAPDSYGGSVSVNQSDDGMHADLVIEPGDLPEADYDVRVMVPDATPNRNTLSFNLQFSTAPILRNGGFEQLDDSGNPEFWNTGAWSVEADTDYEIDVVEDGHTGKCLMIKGTAGSLNLVCGQNVDLILGKTYVLTGYYRGEGKAGHGSLIARGPGGKGQYDNYRGLKATEEWQQFTWEITPTDEDADSFTFYVRLSGVGTAYFDDLVLQPKQ